ncbi:MAG: NAD(P)-dependent oxidoreductase [Gammaproteobacteria bacterium]|nr:NAD(P)-dependent oxidoreductase [Gammaproteobacteria bacterium]
MKKILIVGHQGYLGTRLAAYLHERGYQCSGIDTGFFKDGTLSEPGSVPTIDKDARLLNESDIEGFDVLILLAGISNDPFGHMTSEQIYDPTRDYALSIAEMCKKSGIKFIYPSSCSVYGAAAVDGLLDEESPTNPQTPYSINKIQVEEGLSKIADNTFSPIALRFGTVYGMSPRIRFDVVINMLCGLALTTKKVTLNSNGQAWRPHLHIDDACESFRCCIDWENNSDELMVLNVGRDEDNYKIIDIAKIIHSNVDGSELTYLGSDANKEENELIKDRKIQDGVDTRTYKVSFEKILKVLPGFECKWTVEQGIKSLLNDFQDIGLSKDMFNRKEFYRLQQIEFLHKENLINDDLFWVK